MSEKNTKKEKPYIYLIISVIILIAGFVIGALSTDADFRSYADVRSTSAKPTAAPKVVTTESASSEADESETEKTTAYGTTEATVTTTEAETSTTAETNTVTGVPVTGAYACFNKSAFLGNSRFEGLRNFGLVPNVYTKVGLTVFTVLSETDSSNTVIIEHLDQGVSFDNVFVMFGDNELSNSDNWILSNYKILIGRIKAYQPDAKIYVLSVLPISKERSDENLYGYNSERIKEVNGLLEQMCKSSGVSYINAVPALADASGYLPSSASSDGVHFKKDGYCALLDYIKSHMG